MIDQLREEKNTAEEQIKSVRKISDDISELKSSFKDVMEHASEIWEALQNIPVAQQREFLIFCFEGKRIPVRTLIRGEVEDSLGGLLSLKNLSQPLVIEERGKAIRQVTTDSELSLTGFLRGLEYLKNMAKFDFISSFNAP